MSFWISGTIFKLLPCLLLTLLVSLLTQILKEVKENRQRLLVCNANNISSNKASNASSSVSATGTSNIGIIQVISPLIYNNEMITVSEEKRRHSTFHKIKPPSTSSLISFWNENNENKKIKQTNFSVTTPKTTKTIKSKRKSLLTTPNNFSLLPNIPYTKHTIKKTNLIK